MGNNFDITDGAGEENIHLEPIRDLLRQRHETFLAVTRGKGDPAHGIAPIHAVFADGHEERCGLQLGRKSARGKTINLIVGTHMNETAGWDAVRLLLERYPQNRKSLQGNQINIFFGGQWQQAEAFFNRVTSEEFKAISASELEKYRYTTAGVNCNRIPKETIVPPDSAPDSGSGSWLQQKHTALQRFYRDSDIVIDFHTLSRPGASMVALISKDLNDVENLSSIFALAGAKTAQIFLAKGAPRDVWFMFEGTSPDSHHIDMALECGQHLNPASGDAAIRCVASMIQHYCRGVNIAPERELVLPESILRLHGDPTLLYAPGSGKPNSLMPDIGELPEGATWDPYIHLIGSYDKLPANLQQEVCRREISLPTGDLSNNGVIKKGQAVAYTYYHTAPGTDHDERHPVFFMAPVGGTTFMARQNSHIRRDDPEELMLINSSMEPILVRAAPAQAHQSHARRSRSGTSSPPL